MPDFGQLLHDAADFIVSGITGFLDNLGASLLDVFSGIVALLPTADPLGLDSQSGILIGYAWLNSWLPVSELLAALGTIVAVASLIFAVRVIVKIWEWMPFKFS